MSDTSPWFVTTDRAVCVEADGLAWVEITRTVDCEYLGRSYEQLDCVPYGPVAAWEPEF